MLEPRNFYRIENMVRAVSSRVQRQGAVTRHRAALWVLGRRVLPKVPLLLSMQEYNKNEVTLLAKVRLGEISIVRPDQVRIDSDDVGNLLYFLPGKAPTSKEPPLKLDLSPLVPQSDEISTLATEGSVPPGGELETETKVPAPDGDAEPVLGEVSGEVETSASEKVTSELPIPDGEGPRLCTKCREEPIGEGMTVCAHCAEGDSEEGVRPDEVPLPTEHIDLDVTPQDETPAAEPAEEFVERAPEATERKHNKKKGKKS